MAYKVMEIYRDLPRTNCGECGKGGCLPFATSVFFEGLSLAGCPYLDETQLEQMTRKLREEKGGQEKPAAAVEQALVYLMEKIQGMDFKSIVDKAGVELVKWPPERLRLVLFHLPYVIDRKEVRPEKGEPPSASVKVLLLIYLTRATGKPLTGKWVAFRDLPNTMSKTKSLEDAAARLAESYEGRADELAEASRGLGGEPFPEAAADLDFVFHALPRAPLRLLFWDGDEDFPARASILLDSAVLDYLDQEAIVFLAEAMVALLIGEGLDDLVA